MRSCPKCGRSYQDEYNFCLVDGTILSFATDENRTEVLSGQVAPDSVPTIDSPRKDVPHPVVKEHIPTAEPPLPTIPAFVPKTERPVETKRNVPRILLSVAGGIFIVIVILALVAGVVIGIVESSRQEGPIAVANTTPTRTPTPKPTATASITPTASPTPAPTPTKPIVIPNPTLDPRSAPEPQMPNVEGRYYARQYQQDVVMLSFDVYDQDGTNFNIEDSADKLYGTVHLDRTEKNEFVGYVVWENSSGDKDREIIYVCENWQGLCGKLPFQSWYFVATKRSGDQ